MTVSIRFKRRGGGLLDTSYLHLGLTVSEAKRAWRLFQSDCETELTGSVEFIPVIGGSFVVVEADDARRKELPVIRRRRRGAYSILQRFRRFLEAQLSAGSNALVSEGPHSSVIRPVIISQR